MNFNIRQIACRLSVFILICSLTAVGCGGSQPPVENGSSQNDKQQQGSELDALLGLSVPSNQEQETQQEQGNTGALNVLNPPVETSNEPANTEMQKTIDDLTEKNTKLTGQVDELQFELDKAKYENAEMKSRLSLKDEAIAELQGDVERYKKYSSGQPASSGSRSSTTRKTYPKTKVPPEQFKQQYDNAYNLYLSKDYEGALATFENLLASDPTNNLSDNCQYWIGECYYAMRRYEEGIIAFEKVFTFPKSNKEDDAQLKLGVCYLRLGDKKKAKEEFTRLVNEHPKSEYVPKARQYLSEI